MVPLPPPGSTTESHIKTSASKVLLFIIYERRTWTLTLINALVSKRIHAWLFIAQTQTPIINRTYSNAFMPFRTPSNVSEEAILSLGTICATSQGL